MVFNNDPPMRRSPDCGRLLATIPGSATTPGRTTSRPGDRAVVSREKFDRGRRSSSLPGIERATPAASIQVSGTEAQHEIRGNVSSDPDTKDPDL